MNVWGEDIASLGESMSLDVLTTRTMALLNSIPDLEGVRDSLEAIPGNPPSLLNPPSGCAFRARGSLATDECAASDPPVVTVGDAHSSRCHRTAEIGVGVGAMS